MKVKLHWNNKWIKEEIKKEIRKCLQANNKEDNIINLMRSAKA